MKILVPTSVLPEKKGLRFNFISNIVDSVRKNNDVKIIWVIYQPDKILKKDTSENQILDIHDFKNAIDLVEKSNPDCIMVGQELEPIQHSLSLAAKKFNVPLISFFYNNFEITNSNMLERKKQLLSYLRIILSSRVPSDSSHKGFLRRFRFILFKLNFLKNTKSSLNMSDFNNFFFVFKELFSYLTKKEIDVNIFPDLFLLPDNSWNKKLLSLGIPEKKFAVVGNPILDELYDKSKIIKQYYKNDKISILIVTDALVEHGIWSRTQMTYFFTALIKQLIKNQNFTFSLKIHPSSENKIIYEKLLNKNNVSSKIYQHENILEIIEKFDIVISYGISTIHTEIALLGMKMLLLDLNFNFPLGYFVKEGIECGNIIKCQNFEYMNKQIKQLVDSKLENFSTFEKERKNLIFGFDGLSSKRAADAVQQILKNRDQL